METINISKKDEVYIKIDSDASTAQEICDNFTLWCLAILTCPHTETKCGMER